MEIVQFKITGEEKIREERKNDFGPFKVFFPPLK